MISGTGTYRLHQLLWIVQVLRRDLTFSTGFSSKKSYAISNIAELYAEELGMSKPAIKTGFPYKKNV